MILNPKNPRYHTKAAIKKAVDSLTTFEKMLQVRPIIVDENRVIISGNLRHKALLQIYKDKPIPEEFYRQESDLSQEEKDALLILDNTHTGRWDFDCLDRLYTPEELAIWGDSTSGTLEPEIFEPEDYQENLTDQKHFNIRVFGFSFNIPKEDYEVWRIMVAEETDGSHDGIMGWILNRFGI